MRRDGQGVIVNRGSSRTSIPETLLSSQDPVLGDVPRGYQGPESNEERRSEEIRNTPQLEGGGDVTTESLCGINHSSGETQGG